MTPPRRRIRWIAWAAIVAAATAAPAQDSQPAAGWSALDAELAAPESRAIARTAADKPVTRDAAGGAAGSTLRTAGSLAAVVALVLLVAWGYRTVAGGATLAAAGRRGGAIELVGRLPIAGRQALLLVRVGPRLILVGQTGERLSSLDVISDAGLAASAGVAAGAAGRRQFQAELEREATEYERAAEPRAAENPANVAAVLESARRRIAGAWRSTPGDSSKSAGRGA